MDILYYSDGTIINEGDICCSSSLKSSLEVYYVGKIDQEKKELVIYRLYSEHPSIYNYITHSSFSTLKSGKGFKTDAANFMCRKADWDKIFQKLLVKEITKEEEEVPSKLITKWTQPL